MTTEVDTWESLLSPPPCWLTGHSGCYPSSPPLWGSTRLGSVRGLTSKGSPFPELQTSQGVLRLPLHPPRLPTNPNSALWSPQGEGSSESQSFYSPPPAFQALRLHPTPVSRQASVFRSLCAASNTVIVDSALRELGPPLDLFVLF